MNILITNDDGINSEGLSILAEVFQHDHTIWIIAPDTERSAVSQGITLRDPVTMKYIGERTYSCTGTPADCVLYGCSTLIPVKPDVVISGINRGENIGTDIIFSGTVAAARQAVLHGIPGIALSCEVENPAYREAALLVKEELSRLLGLWNRRIVININVPNGYSRERGLVPAVPSFKGGDNLIQEHSRQEGEISFILTDFREIKTRTDGVLTDAEVLMDGKASITPLLVEPASDEASLDLFRQEYQAGVEP